MRSLILLLVLGVAAFIGFQAWKSRQAPVETLKQFANQLVYGRVDLARRFSEGDLENLEKASFARSAGGAPVDAIHRIAYTVDRRGTAGAGDVVLDVTQTVYFDPPGAMTAIGGAMNAVSRIKGTVRRTAAGWKVVAFEHELIHVSETRENL